MDEEVQKAILFKEIIKYSYYDETQDYVVVLDENKLKEIFNAKYIQIERG